MCTLLSRSLCLPQGLHFRRKEFWLESRWVPKIKAEKGLTQRNSVTVALFTFMCLYGFNGFLCNLSWSAVRQWGTNTIERSLPDSLGLAWVFFPLLDPDSFYWELQKFSGGKPPGLLLAEAWDQRVRSHLPVGNNAFRQSVQRNISCRTQSLLLAPCQMGALGMLLSNPAI